MSDGDPRETSIRTKLSFLVRHPPSPVIFIVLIVFTLISAGASFLLGQNSTWLSSWLQNLSAGIAGSAVTFLILQIPINRREEYWKLTSQLKSSVNSEAIAAAERLQQLGWFETEFLRNIDLAGADLRNANLSHADLRGAFFFYTDLRGADLTFADLRYAHLDSTSRFDETTRLPDFSFWKPDTDMTYFTEGRFRFVTVKRDGHYT